MLVERFVYLCKIEYDWFYVLFENVGVIVFDGYFWFMCWQVGFYLLIDVCLVLFVQDFDVNGVVVIFFGIG